MPTPKQKFTSSCLLLRSISKLSHNPKKRGVRIIRRIIVRQNSRGLRKITYLRPQHSIKEIDNGVK